VNVKEDVYEVVSTVVNFVENEDKGGSRASVVESIPETTGMVLSVGKIEFEVGMEGLPSERVKLESLSTVIQSFVCIDMMLEEVDGMVFMLKTGNRLLLSDCGARR
jgi:hypothetical protein